jgi:hypothetical protein
VVTRGGQVAVQALYRMRSSGQRLAVTLPSGVEFDTEPLRIDGRPTPLESGAKGEFFVPLIGRGGDRPFLLELRYTLPGVGARVDLPAFRDEPAVQKVYVSVFLPEEQEVLGYHGPWTDEQAANEHTIFRQSHLSRDADARLVSWVREGVATAENPGDSFPVDGQLYLFSTLRPEAGEAGSLRLTTFSGNWLDFLVFASVIALGLALLRRSLAERGLALVLLVIGLLLIGVFLPTFAIQILHGRGGLWLAMALTALVWVGWFLLQRANRARAAPIAATAGGTAQAVPIAPASEAPPSGSGPPAESGPPGASEPPAGEMNRGGDVHG